MSPTATTNATAPVRAAVLVLVAFAAALVPLLLLDGDRRALGFRAYGLLLGLAGLRAILNLTVDAGGPPPDSPFERRRRLPRRRPASANSGATRRTPADHLVLSGIDQAGAAHFRLRPVLLEIASERDAAPPTHDLLRPDRPAPHDRRAPGIPEADLAEILTDLETP